MISTNRFKHVLAASVLACAVGLQVAASQQAGPPVVPDPLYAGSDIHSVVRYCEHRSDTEYIRASIGISTNAKQVAIDWRAKAGSAAVKTTDFSWETLSFTPTALCRSRTHPRGFYVAGRSALGPVLEFWEFGDDAVMDARWQPQPAPGRWKTTFEQPTLAKQALPISSSLQNVCGMTAIAPAPTTPAGGEELWVFEYESRNVYGVSPTTGALTLRVSSSLVGAYRSLDARQHSIYGDVVVFDRQPWNVSVSDWGRGLAADPHLDPDTYVLYDQDLNGSMEGAFLIDNATLDAHRLYATGELTDLDY